MECQISLDIRIDLHWLELQISYNDTDIVPTKL